MAGALGALMNMIASVYLWFSLSDNWLGESGILTRLAEHIYYVSLSLVIACAIALPLGVLLANYRKGAQVAIGLFNIGRALPSLGIVILAIMLIGYETSTVIIALVTMSIPPILTNTYVGIDQVDSSLKQAARSMGMRRGQMFFQLESDQPWCNLSQRPPSLRMPASVGWAGFLLMDWAEMIRRKLLAAH
jgi:osmoprotectant transport system permease protein